MHTLYSSHLEIPFFASPVVVAVAIHSNAPSKTIKLLNPFISCYFINLSVWRTFSCILLFTAVSFNLLYIIFIFYFVRESLLPFLFFRIFKTGGNATFSFLGSPFSHPIIQAVWWWASSVVSFIHFHVAHFIRQITSFDAYHFPFAAWWLGRW